MGELATLAAVTTLGGPWRFDATPLTAFLAVAAIFVIIGADRLTARASQAVIFRAAREEELAEVRAVFESRATALLHDTILNQLAVVTSTVAGRLSTVGGTATVWSQPGKGTSVLLRVPTRGATL